MRGVIRTTVGYAGGTSPQPTYRTIGDHSETIRLEFDPQVITYEALLDVFWHTHDAFRPGWSRQYRSAIFYQDDAQREAALASLERAEAAHGRKATTAIEPAGEFTRAEDYHQKYYLRGDRILAAEFSELYPDEREFADSTAAARVNSVVAGYGGATVLERDGEELGLSEEAMARLWHLVRGRAVHAKGVFYCE